MLNLSIELFYLRTIPIKYIRTWLGPTYENYYKQFIKTNYATRYAQLLYSMDEAGNRYKYDVEVGFQTENKIIYNVRYTIRERIGTG